MEDYPTSKANLTLTGILTSLMNMLKVKKKNLKMFELTMDRHLFSHTYSLKHICTCAHTHTHTHPCIIIIQDAHFIFACFALFSETGSCLVTETDFRLTAIFPPQPQSTAGITGLCQHEWLICISFSSGLLWDCSSSDNHCRSHNGFTSLFWLRVYKNNREQLPNYKNKCHLGINSE